MPCRLSVDETWYIEAYEDIARGIEEGEINSAEEHFNVYGYAEGRVPAKLPGFS